MLIGPRRINNYRVYNAAPQKPLLMLGGMASTPYVGAWTNGLHALAGFAGVLGLLACRAYLGWGLHPTGFLGASVHAPRTRSGFRCCWAGRPSR